MGKFADLEKILKDLDDKYVPKWEAEKKQKEELADVSGNEKGDKDE